MRPEDFERCSYCNRTQTDPVMGTADAMGYCDACGEPVCEACADHDASLEGESYVPERICQNTDQCARTVALQGE